MKRLLIIFLSLLFVVTASFADNQPKFYQVELIVFQRTIPTPPGTDLWSDKPMLPNLTNAVELHQPQENLDQNYQLLPSEDFKLSPEVNALNKSNKYNVLVHIAWIQQIQSPHNTNPINIFGGLAYNQYGDIISAQTDQPDTLWQINGLIWISHTRYFEVKTRLYYTALSINYPAYLKLEEAIHQQSPLITFRLQQARRTRSNELNYFDHPIFGMLIKIIPVH